MQALRRAERRPCASCAGSFPWPTSGGTVRTAPVGLPVRDYKENYETLVYGKGAEFFDTLRDELGPESFDRLLRTYLERYRWRIATPEKLRALAEEVSGKELEALFAKWVEGKE